MVDEESSTSCIWAVQDTNLDTILPNTACLSVILFIVTPLHFFSPRVNYYLFITYIFLYLNNLEVHTFLQQL